MHLLIRFTLTLLKVGWKLRLHDSTGMYLLQDFIVLGSALGVRYQKLRQSRQHTFLIEITVHS